MADSTDIDVLVVAARATARELNELLDKLEAGGVEVSVIRRPAEGYQVDVTRVSLGLVFVARSDRPQHQSALRQSPYPTGNPCSPVEALRHLKNQGII